MKKRNRIVSVFLMVAMLLPMIVSAPITANAELQVNARTTFAEVLDFENATVGETLTQEYVNAQFYAPFRASTLAASDFRSPAFWQVESETDGEGNVNTYIGRKADKQYASFCIEDPGMYLWNVPFEISFDVRFNSYSINNGNNGDTSILQLFPKSDYSKVVKLLGTKKSGSKLYLQKLANADSSVSNFNNGTAIAEFTFGKWHNIRAQVYADSGRVIVWFDDAKVADFISDEFIYKGVHYGSLTPTGSVLGIGSGWGSPTDIDIELDNITLCSSVNETETFDGFALDKEYTSKNEIKSYVDATLNYSNRYSLSFLDAEGKEYWSVVDDGNGDKYLRQYIPRGDSGATGFKLVDNKKDGILSKQKFEVSFTLNHTTRTGVWWTPVSLMGYNKVTQKNEEFPLIYSRNSWVYLYGYSDTWHTANNKTGQDGTRDSYTGCSTYLLQDIAGSEYKKIVKFQMEAGKSYDFRYVIDPTVKVTDSTGATVNAPTLEIFVSINGGAEQSVYFTEDETKYNHNSTGHMGYTATMTTEKYPVKTVANIAYIDPQKSQIWNWTNMDLKFLHMSASNPFSSITNDVGSSNVASLTNIDFTVDDISIKSIDTSLIPGLAWANRWFAIVDETIDFDTDTDGYEDSSFVVTDSPVANMKITNWEKAIDPVEGGTRGNVIHTSPNAYRPDDGIYAGSTYTVVDSENALLGNEFEFSFDMNVAKAPGNWINLLKVHTKTTKNADGSFSISNSPNFVPLRMIALSSEKVKVTAYSSILGNQIDGNNGLGFQVAFNTNEWVNFKMRLNPNTGVMLLFFNNELVFESTVAALYDSGKLTDMNCMMFEIFNQWTATAATNLWGEYYLDNVSFRTLGAIDVKPEFTDYVVLNADFEDGGAWLDSAKKDSVPNFTLGYANASIINMGENNALDLSGNNGSLMSYRLNAMAGYHNTFTLEMSVSYNDIHGSAVSLATVSDSNIDGGKTELLRAYGENAKAERTRALYFISESYNYFLYDKAGNLLHVADIGSGKLTKIAFVVDAKSNRYAIYVNESPAYIREDAAENGELKLAKDIPLGMLEDSETFMRPTLKLFEAPTEANSKYRLYVDDIRISSVKNGLAPVFDYYQDKPIGPTVAVRFLATVDMLYYDAVGFIVKGTNGGEKDLRNNIVFSSVIAADKDVTAEDLGGRYIAPFTVTEIPDKGAVTFEVTPYVVFMGEIIMGEKSVIPYRQ